MNPDLPLQKDLEGLLLAISISDCAYTQDRVGEGWPH